MGAILFFPQIKIAVNSGELAPLLSRFRSSTLPASDSIVINSEADMVAKTDEPAVPETVQSNSTVSNNLEAQSNPTNVEPSPISTIQPTQTGNLNGATGAGEIPSTNIGRLIIPEIEIDGSTVSVPIVDDRWVIEDLGKNIGILEGGGRFPQDEKSMIFAGHATTLWPIKGPFAKLGWLSKEDEFSYVYQGQQYDYKISKMVWAEPDQISMLNSDNGDQVILVTCGEYDFYVGRYDKRLVVFADLINVEPISGDS